MACSSPPSSYCKAHLLIAVWICCLLAFPGSIFALPKRAPSAPEANLTNLTFYVHEKRTEPASLIMVAPTTGPLTDVKWGSVVIIDNEVRATNATDSTLLGRQLGNVVVGSDNQTFYASYTYLLNTTEYEGSLTVAGIVQSGKMVVTGGTDSFSFVRGVASVTTLSNTPTAALYLYTLTLKF
jgi:hypothetical protein